MNIKKNDTVLIIKGKDRGKTGKVTKALPKSERIVIAGLNTQKKHSKPSRKNPSGGIIDLHMPIKSHNVMIICPRCNKKTRIGYKITGKNKIRICKKCQESLD